MLSNTLRLNFFNLKIIHIFHQCYDPKVIGRFLINMQKNNFVSIHKIIRLIMMKMKMKMKNRSNRSQYDTTCIVWIKQHVSNI